MEIVTPRLLLRPIKPADAEDIFDIRSREEAMRWAYVPETDIAQTLAFMHKRRDAFIFSVVIRSPLEAESNQKPTRCTSVGSAGGTTSSDGKVIGIIGGVSPHPAPEIGYMFHPSCFGRGYATEALKAFIPMYWAKVPPAFEKSRVRSSLDVVEEDSKPGKAAELKVRVGNDENAESHRDSNVGYDYIEAATDSENTASHRVLEKCGFSFWSKTKDDFYSPLQGVRSTVRYRLARPGTTLQEPPIPSTSGYHRKPEPAVTIFHY